MKRSHNARILGVLFVVCAVILATTGSARCVVDEQIIDVLPKSTIVSAFGLVPVYDAV